MPEMLGGAFIVLKYVFLVCVPVLGWLWTMFWNRQKDQDRAVDKLKDDSIKLEKEFSKESNELRERIIKLESTAVTTEQQRQMLREYSADMEERFESKMNDLKEFMKELITQLSKKDK